VADRYNLPAQCCIVLQQQFPEVAESGTVGDADSGVPLLAEPAIGSVQRKGREAGNRRQVLREHTMVTAAQHVIIALNPRAGSRTRGELAQQLAELLQSHGFHASISTNVEQLCLETRRLRAAGQLRAVVAAGGDGTAALIAQSTEPGIPMAILPLGTENLLAKELGVTRDPARLCQAICRGQTRQLDAGLAAGRLFLLMLGCGFDAEVVHRLHATRKGHIRHLAYAKPILDCIRNYQYPKLRVYCQSAPSEQSGKRQTGIAPTGRKTGCFIARWVFVANLPQYALGLKMAPEARGDDGQLDVCAFQRGSLWHGLRYLTGVITRRHTMWRDVVQCRALRLRIEADEAVPYQLDGDPGGFLPVDVEVLPGRLTVIVS
jgi:diacylglycerol kinase family enzyme